MNKNRPLEFLRNSISMKIESHQTEPEKRKISMKNVAWYWRVPYIKPCKKEFANVNLTKVYRTNVKRTCIGAPDISGHHSSYPGSKGSRPHI